MARPNFLFILIDVLGWRDLACTGSTFYETPNLNRLAAAGMSFTDAYAACPVCSPTRASILTGKYPARLSLTNWIGGHETGRLISAPYIDHLPLTERTIARALRDVGYRTYHVGKWHLGEQPYWPEQHGFDVNIGGCDWGAPRYGYFSPYHCPTLADGPQGEYLTNRQTDEAIRLIEDNGSQPFFMYLSHYAVHIPIQAPLDLVDKYIDKASALGLDRQPTFALGESFPCDHKRHLRVIRRLLQSDPAYAAMVECLDAGIGRVLQALEDTGQASNTVVFLTSDNGGLATSEGSPTCNAPLSEGKGWMYEGGTREPLIVRWPDHIAPGSTCSVPVTSTDFYPTLLEMAGLELDPDQHRDGVSLLPLLRGADEIERGAIYWHYPHYGNQGGTPGSSIRAGDLKLIEFFESGTNELYNLRDDISERQNLARDLPQVTAEMADELACWREQVQARLPAPNPDYRP